jgi:protein involved in polysaccharide export with SLBB domain
LPGEYPLEPNMTVSDLIRAGGNLSDAAYGGKAELTRYTVVDGEARRTELIDIDLANVLMGNKEADIALRPFDFLNIQEIPEWTAQEKVTLKGEVKFPGVYPIKRGETLRSVLQRAGGLTDLSFPQGGVFTRRQLREREQEQLDQLAARLQNDLATMALQGAAANQAAAGQANVIGQSLLQQLKSSRAVGRLVIDVDGALAGQPGSAGDIVLLDGDVLMIPKRSQEVTVIGEVQNATSHFYRPRLERDDYVSLSGGATRKADSDRIYVVRANGTVMSGENSKWFSRGSRVEVGPGDTIVVPLDTERLPSLPFWQAVTQIVYNLAISAAAVNSFR